MIRGRTARWLAGAAGVLLVLLAWRTTTDDSTDLPDVAGSPRAADILAPGATDARPPGAPSAPPASLPPNDAPLASVLAPLTNLAESGDRRAACRLGVELLRCEQLVLYGELESAPENDAEAPSPRVAAYLAWKSARLLDCHSVPPDLRARGGHYLRQAALAGQPEAMVRYAEGHHFPPDSRGLWATEAFDQWRREAPGMMQRAVEAGYPQAVFALQFGYLDDLTPATALVPNDHEQALVMRLLHARLYGKREVLLRDDLSASALLRARERAAEMHQQFFGGRKFEGPFYPEFVLYPPENGHATSRFCRDP